mmetsp:Transcript_56037/g.137433  ORF Transcript_56037/g.137433 Transcript_56037/m.137433 type:complete len:326 (+) Transcript_56037:44-1021(+)|eukprot:CAMPEP_0206230324 /NCGR_PEP_ID=MMETSP0047_2-20121206/10195_1 /ASSEMBLY_ACC=CAM_ASM_000192 /TAXON_ID=195065 /ORGANISM="Chroomonas mesostigmatica_cf, Strain CCMP1168" /LENGTH=325 /DNA_ID=CAMNT_0053653733 /DNA_START=44 /DNA_END=1021 /DNA_ORIENTATION=+
MKILSVTAVAVCLCILPLMHALPQSSISCTPSALRGCDHGAMRPSGGALQERLRGGRHLTKGFWKNKKAEWKQNQELAAALAKEASAKALSMQSGRDATSPAPPSSAPPPAQTDSPVAQGLVMATCLFSLFFPLARGGFTAENTEIVLLAVAGMGSLIFSLYFLGTTMGVTMLRTQRENTIRCLGINLLVQIAMLAHAHINIPAAFPFLRRLENPVTRSHFAVFAASMLVLLLTEADRPSDLAAADETIVAKLTTIVATTGVWFGYWFGASYPLYKQYMEGKELSLFRAPFSALYTLLGLYYYIINPFSKIAPCTAASDFGPADQ